MTLVAAFSPGKYLFYWFQIKSTIFRCKKKKCFNLKERMYIRRVFYAVIFIYIYI